MLRVKFKTDLLRDDIVLRSSSIPLEVRIPVDLSGENAGEISPKLLNNSSGENEVLNVNRWH
jgi:hypothetical protein